MAAGLRIGGGLLVLSMLAGMAGCQTLTRGEGFGDLFVVAHEDDDLLFMNPDIQRSIARGHRVQTVYLTAGDGCRSEQYWRAQREAGVRAAYAQMAGVEDRWVDVAVRPKEVRLLQRSQVSLVFFRLPSPAKEDGTSCPHGATLEKLWTGRIAELSALDDPHVTYTKHGLVDELTKVLRIFRPDRVNALDGTGRNPVPCSSGNPAVCRVYYPATGRAYLSDHSDHYYSALFAREAHVAYQRPHQFQSYRGYNSALEPPNVSDSAFLEKERVFQTYAEHDDRIDDHPPFDDFYHLWLLRQYEAH